MTLIELMIACTIMAIMAATVSALAMAAQKANEYNQGQGAGVQHGRIIVERIQQTLREAHANEEFPGFAVFGPTVSGRLFPERLVVWHPNGSPADPAGRPRFNELVIYGPHEKNPRLLLEVTAPKDTRVTPPLSDTATWNTELSTLLASDGNAIQLTDLTRTALPVATTTPRAAVRFRVLLRPSASEWTQFKSGTLAWDDLPFAQDIRGSQTGLRHAWCSFEIQLMPGADAFTKDPSGATVVPFLGSAALLYEMHR